MCLGATKPMQQLEACVPKLRPDAAKVNKYSTKQNKTQGNQSMTELRKEKRNAEGPAHGLCWPSYQSPGAVETKHHRQGEVIRDGWLQFWRLQAAIQSVGRVGSLWGLSASPWLADGHLLPFPPLCMSNVFYNKGRFGEATYITNWHTCFQYVTLPSRWHTLLFRALLSRHPLLYPF